ncbi:hypothetical protein QMK19_03615 [Streptomyces sp. H10-C2]|uniref:hypothetical protein n=1 Tax=unclassified Streptomyces TaxID=2593676 RepID=UPI0024BB172D|nr:MULTISPECIES: hypothetical protein [unclassified Streptomyces]MDJ0342275.1 hypothetical protein [Streptomyces sp. PH10-H1]MDJ0368789.1 hypothetical protein [Streptomyces sp. H10-C2]
MPFGDQNPAVMNRENAGTFFVDSLVVNGTANVGGALGVAGVGANTGPWIFNASASAYGAVGDGKVATDGAMTSGSNVLACTTSLPFTKADIGKVAMVKGAGATAPTTLVTPITGFIDPGHVTVATPAATTISGATVLWATDDTAPIQAAINDAVAWAQAHSGAATVFLPAAPGRFYGIAGPLKTTVSGNSQLTLPVVATTGNKVILTITGPSDASGVQHWQQLTPQFSGATLVSFGVFTNPTTQATSINTSGNPALIGGPSQPGGYGISPGVFTNLHVVLENLALRTTHSAWGCGYSAADLSGCANATISRLAYGTIGTVGAADFGNPSLFGNGASMGLLMPASGNNDLCIIREVTCHGGYTYALAATEHSDLYGVRLLYCWAGLCCVGTYFGSVGAVHAIRGFVSIEACKKFLYIIGPGSGGIGPFLHLLLDIEGTPTIGDSTSGTSLAAARGEVVLTGQFTAGSLTLDAPIGFKLINDQVSFPVNAVTANYAVTTLDEVVLVDATGGPVTVTLPTAVGRATRCTVQKTDASANAVTVATTGGQTIKGASTFPLATRWTTVTAIPSGGNWYVT